MNRVVVKDLISRRGVFGEKEIGRISKRLLRRLKKNNCFLEIFLVGRRKMKFFNKKFRDKNEAASVLTFVEPKNFPHPESRLKVLGEIYLNAESPRLSGSAPLLVHGILHLLGFEHRKNSDRIKMEKMEKRLLKIKI